MHMFSSVQPVCLSVGAFNPFTCKVIITMYDPIWPFTQFMTFSWQVYWVACHSLLHAEAEATVFWSSDTDDSLEKSLMLGKIKGGRRGCLRMRWQDGITDATNMNSGKLWEMVRDREARRAEVHRVTKSRTGLGE